jgi:hypothetical protein
VPGSYESVADLQASAASGFLFSKLEQRAPATLPAMRLIDPQVGNVGAAARVWTLTAATTFQASPRTTSENGLPSLKPVAWIELVDALVENRVEFSFGSIAWFDRALGHLAWGQALELSRP